MNRKAELLEERKKKWSSGRAVNDLTEQVTKEVSSTQEPPKIGSPRARQDGHGGVSTDVILHRLTDKLTEHIRHELQREMHSMKSADVRETVAEKLESYLEAELSTHTCKICFELMTSPVHTPILLFPCGHTFCQQCMDSHMGLAKGQAYKPASSSSGKTCPYCRVRIESRAVNQPLKELIDQFSRQKQMVQAGSAQHLDDVFPTRSSPTRGSGTRLVSGTPSSSSRGSGRGGESPAPASSLSSTAAHYAAQLRSCEMRHTILRNELADVELEESQLSMREAKIAKASDHLIEERRKLEAQLQLLLEERDLIDKHLAEQRAKREELQRSEAALKERAGLVRGTLRNLQAEMEKLKLLVEGAQL